MVQAAELQSITPNLAIWSAYDDQVKAELFSTAIQLEDRLYLVDPILLAEPALAELTTFASICGILITNVNHARAATDFAAQSGAALLGSPATAGALWNLEIISIDAGEHIGECLEVVEISGAAEGEMALHCEEEGGTLIVGDALINFGSEGFAFLPPKYCADQKLLRSSLRQLLDFSFARILFAHGTPIVTAARQKLETLLG